MIRDVTVGQWPLIHLGEETLNKLVKNVASDSVLNYLVTIQLIVA